MAGILDTLTRLFRGRTQTDEPVVTTGQQVGVQSVTSSPAGGEDYGHRFRGESERVDIVKACRLMYKEDPRAKRLLTTLSRDATHGGCSVVVRNNPKAQEIADGLFKRIQLNRRLDDWAKFTFRDGDSFLELGIAASRRIVEVTRKPTLGMHRNTNKYDRFLRPDQAYWFAENPWPVPTPPADAVWFADWQILHARWDHDEGSRYGTPLFAAATGPYKRVKEGETDIAIRRKVRAGMRYNHQFPQGTSEDSIKAYMELNKEVLDDDEASISDFFGVAEIKPVQGDAKLQEIGDVKFHVATWLLAGILPMELIGYGEDLNRDVLEEKKAQYDRDLETITGWVESELVIPLLEMEWLLQGVLPDSLDYEVKWKSKQVLTASVLKDVADAMLKLRALGYRDELLNTILERFIPDIDLELLLTPPSGDDNPEKVASNLDDTEDDNSNGEEDNQS